jgi:hypothetical protein
MTGPTTRKVGRNSYFPEDGRARLNSLWQGEMYMTITKTKGGYQVKSKAGKPLSPRGISRKQAVKRLAQVEFFKRKGKGKA